MYSITEVTSYLKSINSLVFSSTTALPSWPPSTQRKHLVLITSLNPKYVFIRSRIFFYCPTTKSHEIQVCQLSNYQSPPLSPQTTLRSPSHPVHLLFTFPSPPPHPPYYSLHPAFIDSPFCPIQPLASSSPSLSTLSPSCLSVYIDNVQHHFSKSG